MSKYKNVQENIFSNPIDKLQQIRKKPPSIEALRQYRELLKFSNEFYWTNERGQLWKDIIRKSARREFELSRNEEDPMIQYKMMITTRDAISKTKETLIEEYFKQNRNMEKIFSPEEQNDYRNYTKYEEKPLEQKAKLSYFEEEGDKKQYQGP